MTGHGEKLTRKQEQAIAALLSASSIQAAAKSAGVSEKTLRRWLALAPFQAAYRAARRQLVERTLALLQQASGEAVEVLGKLMKGKHAPSKARAALGIIDRAIAALETGDVLDRLDRMEERLRDIEKAQQGRAAEANGRHRGRAASLPPTG